MMDESPVNHDPMREVIKLREENVRMEKEIARLRAAEALAKEEIAYLKRKVSALVHRMFGSSSERFSPDQLSLDFGESLALPPAPQEEEKPAPALKVLPRARKLRKPRIPDNLPVVENIIDPEEVTQEPENWRKIGEEVSEQLDYKPAQFMRVITVRRTFVRRDNPDAAPITAPLPPRLMERGKLGVGLLAHIAVSKYCHHLPLYRQEKIYRQQNGVELSRQTMSRAIGMLAWWLKPVVKTMLNEQLASGYVQIDETPVRYLKPGAGKAPRGYMWVVYKPGGHTVYHWAAGRGREHLLELIPPDYEGYVQSDGYGVYTSALRDRPGLTLAGCWAHVRRKFYESMELGEAPWANQWIHETYQKLSDIEERLRMSNASARIRQAVRAHESAPIIARLRAYLMRLEKKQKYPPRSGLGVAVRYALPRWEALTVFLRDGRIEMDNNLVENAIRPAALGRKNWLFIGDEDAGWHSAIMYSIMHSCHTQGINPYEYLCDVLERLPMMQASEIPTITPMAWAKAREAAKKSAA